MRDARRSDHLDRPQRRIADAVEQALARAEEDRYDVQVQLVEQAGGRALAVRCDVSREAEVKAALDKAVETFGRLDIAFNNAGVEQPLKALADLTVEDWDRIAGIDQRSFAMHHDEGTDHRHLDLISNGNWNPGQPFAHLPKVKSVSGSTSQTRASS